MNMIRLTPQKLRDIISESVIKTLITESQESASIKEATRLVMDRLGYSKEQADNFIRIDLRASFPILRSKQGGKFILGVARMYLDRQISDASTISSLNQTLKYIVTPAHYNEYDRNLNGLSAQQLIDRFKLTRTDDLEKDKAELAKTHYAERPEYNIVRIDSFEQAKQYGGYNDWCLAQDDGEVNYDQYTSNGVNQLYFILRDGFENEPRIKGKNAPYDSYGLSMMTVIVDPEGMMTQSTTRWNHENDSNDSAFTPKQISNIIGRNFYEVFKPNTKFKDAVTEALELLRNGEPIGDCFDTVRAIKNGSFIVELFEKENILTAQKVFKYPKWFDFVESFHEGFARVKLNNKMTFINENGDLICDGKAWFDFVGRFIGGLAGVRADTKYSFINTDGKLISDGNLWFDEIEVCCTNGLRKVRLNNKYSFVNNQGALTGNGDLWFDFAGDFLSGFSRIKSNGKWSFINTQGELIGDGNLWFDWVGSFDDGLALVKLNRKYSFINTKGELIGNGNLWFDWVEPFCEGFAVVKLNNRWSFINTKGELIGDGNAWFDLVSTFHEGFARVVLNRKECKIKVLPDNEVQFYDEYTETPIPSPLNSQNESENKMISLRITESQYRKLIKEMADLGNTQYTEKPEIDSFELQKLYGKYPIFMKALVKALEKLKMGARVEEAFEETWKLDGGAYLVSLFEKYNILTPQKTLKYKKWFDRVSDFNQGFAIVRLHPHKVSFINTKGELIGNGNLWFNWVEPFSNGFARVESKYAKVSFINTKGELIDNGNLWFNEADKFSEGFAKVRVKDKWSFINTQGKFIGNENLRFDEVRNFREGFAAVKLKGQWSFINTQGKFIGNGNLWFDEVRDFREGFAAVKLKGQWSFINTQGNLIGNGNLWFDNAWYDSSGHIHVELGRPLNSFKHGKEYIIKILPNNEIQFLHYWTKQPIPSPLNSQNESITKKINLR